MGNSSGSAKIGFYDIYQLLCCNRLVICRVFVRIKDMESDVAFNNFINQGIDGAPARRSLLEHTVAIPLFRELFFKSVQLPLNAVHSAQEFLFVSDGMRHKYSFLRLTSIYTPV